MEWQLPGCDTEHPENKHHSFHGRPSPALHHSACPDRRKVLIRDSSIITEYNLDENLPHL